MDIMFDDESKETMRHVVRDALKRELLDQGASFVHELGELSGDGSLIGVLQGVLKVELEACAGRLRNHIHEDVGQMLDEKTVSVGQDLSIAPAASESLNYLHSLLKEQKELLLQLLQTSHAFSAFDDSVPRQRAVNTNMEGRTQTAMPPSEVKSEAKQDRRGESIGPTQTAVFADAKNKMPERRPSNAGVMSLGGGLMDELDKVDVTPGMENLEILGVLPGSISADIDIKAQEQSQAKRRSSLAGITSDAMRSFKEAFSGMDGSDSEEQEQPETCRGRFQARVARVVLATWFDMLISFFIILNAITIGVQSDWMVRQIGQKEPFAFVVVEKVYLFVFLAELVARWVALGFAKFYFGPEWKWAWFDSIIVGLQVFEEISILALGEAGAADSGGGGNFGFLRILRILRLLRIMRLVRILRFVQELRTMVSSIAGSMKSLVWTLVLMFLMMYVLGVYLCQVIADTGLENKDIMQQEPDLLYYYEGLPRTIVTLYQAMTGGADWNDLSKPLENGISPFLGVVFVLYIAFAVLAMMNVVTGVFVESALLTAKEDREKDVMRQVRRMFNNADKDKSGVITWNEFNEQCDDPSMAKYFETLEMEPQEARALFRLLDTDESGSIDAEEFMQGCLKLRGPARSIDLATLMYSNKRLMRWWRKEVKHIRTRLMRMNNSVLALKGGEARKDSDSEDVMEVFTTWAEVKASDTRSSSKR
eukprot:TRINITY_DN103157_c0_g1_i1.p1 TRINITY_DN103157_c0_g1~~TRINITY_DN103157_c0_g1_i1.p1  ORF type:complete len:722 (-),score=146.13 TRINITY_DN103157_c0_g1_i1:67-2187(-)